VGRRGLLIVLCGPSGVGKGTLRARLLERHPEMVYAVSATTRPPRRGERDGVDYYFLDRPEFERRVTEQEFVEWAEVYGYCYGTPRQPMESHLADGTGVLVEKDVQGAATLRRLYPSAVFVFVMPPSAASLRGRLERRGTDRGAGLKRRLGEAQAEMAQSAEFDHVVVNDDPGRAVDALERIIEWESARRMCRTGEGSQV